MEDAPCPLSLSCQTGSPPSPLTPTTRGHTCIVTTQIKVDCTIREKDWKSEMSFPSLRSELKTVPMGTKNSTKEL